MDHRRGQNPDPSQPAANGKRGYAMEYINTTGLPSPPQSTMRARSATSSSLSIDRQASISYFSVSETDDAAVRASGLPSPASHRSRQGSVASPTSASSSRSAHLSPLVLSVPLNSPRSGLNQLQPPYTCAFQDAGIGNMVLAPPRDAPNQTPLYFIDVRPNCFMPTSFVTSVYRGNREPVGRFECVVCHWLF